MWLVVAGVVVAGFWLVFVGLGRLQQTKGSTWQQIAAKNGSSR